jgi:hypothetical protein
LIGSAALAFPLSPVLGVSTTTSSSESGSLAVELSMGNLCKRSSRITTDSGTSDEYGPFQAMGFCIQIDDHWKTALLSTGAINNEGHYPSRELKSEKDILKEYGGLRDL